MLIHVLHGQVKTSFVKELSLEELRPSGRTSCFKPDGRGFGDLLLYGMAGSRQEFLWL